MCARTLLCPAGHHLTVTSKNTASIQRGAVDAAFGVGNVTSSLTAPYRRTPCENLGQQVRWCLCVWPNQNETAQAHDQREKEEARHRHTPLCAPFQPHRHLQAKPVSTPTSTQIDRQTDRQTETETQTPEADRQKDTHTQTHTHIHRLGNMSCVNSIIIIRTARRRRRRTARVPARQLARRLRRALGRRLHCQVCGMCCPS